MTCVQRVIPRDGRWRIAQDSSVMASGDATPRVGAAHTPGPCVAKIRVEPSRPINTTS